MKQLIFQATLTASLEAGQTIHVFDDGSGEGLPEGTIVSNYFIPLIQELQGQLEVQKNRADSNERMFHAACEDLGLLSEAFDIDSNIEGGADPILEAIDVLKEDLEAAKKVISVVDSLVTAKGRYHTAQWYQKMVTALDEYKASIKEQQ